MKISRPIVSVFLLIALSVICLSAKAQKQYSRVKARQVSEILQRLGQSSGQFRDSLNNAVGKSRANGRLENDISSFAGDFENATTQLNDRFKRRHAGPADVRNVLQKAAPVNDLISSRRFGAQAQNDWASVRSNLEALASAYAVRWQWTRQTLPPVNSGESSQLSDGELDQLIQRIENAGDALRVSLTAAFDKTPYDRTTSESAMNDAVRRFKTATDQLRNHFDIRQLVVGDVERLIGQATPLETFMRNHALTERVQSDWSALRAELSTLASAYNVNHLGGINPSVLTGYNAVTSSVELKVPAKGFPPPALC